MTKPLFQQPVRRAIFLVFLLAATGSLLLVALVIPFVSSLSEAPLKEGDVASQDIRAPAAKGYTSELLTEDLRQRRSAAVEPVYTSPDTSIARRQLDRLRAALAFINVVRTDALSTDEQKLDDLAALEDIQLRKDTAQRLLELSNSRWETVQRETIVVLEQVMRTPIREDRLEEARLSVPATISLYVPEDQAHIITELASAFITPNSLYNQEQTEAARQQAYESVAPVGRSFAAGETIVQRGQVITGVDIEALTQFGLLEPRYRWQDLAGAFSLVVLIMGFLAIYTRRNQWLEQDLRRISVITLLFLAFLFGARLIIPGHTVIPYVFPLAAYGLVVAALFGLETALISALPLAVLATYGLPYALELSLFYGITSFVGILILGKARRITSFFWTGLGVSVAGMIVIVAYRLPQPGADLVGVLTLAGASLISGVASAGIALLLQFFLAQILGMTTALQLLELSRPDHPLLQLLLRNAPGTYQHSLQVANLAEQAAEKIGADALLTRVGALYHDVGKIEDSVFFIENQAPGSANPHDDLDPATSAALIIRHIPKGMELARKHRLPRRIQEFIPEHHGSLITRYQYSRAVEAAGGDEDAIDSEDFRYPGPRPQSRETALLMLADGCEARVRAERPKDEVELRAIIKDVVDTSVATGALNDTDLTLQDLDAIIDSFTATLRGIYHPRIQYPKLETITNVLEAELHEPLSLPESLTEEPEPASTNPDVSSYPS